MAKDTQNHDRREAFVKMTRSHREDVDVSLLALYDCYIGGLGVLTAEAGKESEAVSVEEFSGILLTYCVTLSTRPASFCGASATSSTSSCSIPGRLEKRG